jgi:hypothetical protein
MLHACAHTGRGGSPGYRGCPVTGTTSAAAAADRTGVITLSAGSRLVSLMSGPEDGHGDNGYFENSSMNCAKVSFTPSMWYDPMFLELEAYLAKNAGLVW